MAPRRKPLKASAQVMLNERAPSLNKPQSPTSNAGSKQTDPQQQSASSSNLSNVDNGARYSVFELQAMLDTFELDATSKMQALRRNQMLGLDAMRRRWQTATASIDPQVCDMTMRTFISEYAADYDAALRGVVGIAVRQTQQTMSHFEHSARKRKRLDQASPSDPRGPSNLAGSATKGTSVRARSGRSLVAASPSTKSTNRRTRLKLRSSDVAGDRDRNFVYDVSKGPMINPRLPATPSSKVGGITRRPRRGESIMISSINGSPLGEFVASDVELEDGDENETMQSLGADEWDVLDENEASRVEDNGRSSSRGSKMVKARKAVKKGATGSQKLNSSVRSGHPPTGPYSSREGAGALATSRFEIELPKNAPSYEELKRKVIDDMRAGLATKVMSSEQRAYLVESLEAFIQAA
ncbi:hypothetical protein OIO90_006433 [Microbotryomycetes sp. JL221]|nr:hypothetical protein OIO90_006433 [Microbotryomycetes sp. JL221]